MSTIDLFLTRLTSRKIGRDEAGNTYYESRRPDPVYGRTRRTVALAKGLDSSIVPPEWHAWLHYTTDAPLAPVDRPWIRPHQPNATGTPAAWRPRGSQLREGRRARATGDYEPWTPG